jgi:multiple sugar transport system substrate-binding protein
VQQGTVALDCDCKFPMADVIRDSINTAGPRPGSPYYSNVSAATVREVHPPSAVDRDSIPGNADDVIHNVLQDRQLL